MIADRKSAEVRAMLKLHGIGSVCLMFFKDVESQRPDYKKGVFHVIKGLRS